MKFEILGRYGRKHMLYIKFGIGSWFSALQCRQFPHRASLVRATNDFQLSMSRYIVKMTSQVFVLLFYSSGQKTKQIRWIVFLGESTTRKSAYGFIWPLAAACRQWQPWTIIKRLKNWIANPKKTWIHCELHFHIGTIIPLSYQLTPSLLSSSYRR
jgi:hypothetical protein